MSERPNKKRRTSKQKEEEAEPKNPPTLTKPSGHASSPIVEARHDGRLMQRSARGFSPGEIAQASLNVVMARSWGVVVDDRRRSVLASNVASLKAWAPQPQKPAGGEEEKARKLERSIRKDVRKLEQEAKKVEEEVVEKVEAPVKKRQKAAKEKKTTAVKEKEKKKKNQ